MRRDLHLVKELESDSVEQSRQLFTQEEALILNGGMGRKISESALNGVKSRLRTVMAKQTEKVSVAMNTLCSIRKYMRRIDDDLHCFESLLEETACFESIGAAAGTEVAIRPDCYNESEWILGRVVKFYKDTGI